MRLYREVLKVKLALYLVARLVRQKQHVHVVLAKLYTVQNREFCSAHKLLFLFRLGLLPLFSFDFFEISFVDFNH